MGDNCLGDDSLNHAGCLPCCPFLFSINFRKALGPIILGGVNGTSLALGILTIAFAAVAVAAVAVAAVSDTGVFANNAALRGDRPLFMAAVDGLIDDGGG
jgi:hypothetical protein